MKICKSSSESENPPSILLEKVLYPNQINKPVRDTHVQHRTP